MGKQHNFTDNVQCSQCKYCSYDEDDSSYYCNKKEMSIEAVEEFDECNIFELLYSQETQEAIKTLEENMYWLASYTHSIYQSIGEDKDKVHKAVEAVDNIVSYYTNWVKNVKWEYL